MTNKKKKETCGLGDRMKLYEKAYKVTMPIRLPLIIRVDGKSFHSYTQGLKHPFDSNFELVMNDAAIALCKEIPRVNFAYVQSDEISLLLYDGHSQKWYGNSLQKIVSMRNSIYMYARSMYSHKILQGKSCSEMTKMCLDSGQPWDTLPLQYQRGRAIVKDPIHGRGWIVENEIPIFKLDRQWVENNYE